MKKLAALLFTTLGFFLFVSPVFAQNKCGVNIGPNYDQVGQVSALTQTGGWVVALGSPGNCSGFESLFGQGLNVVIRAYNGGKVFTNDQALGWVATLGHLNTQGQKVYFMPWNEPNHAAECGGRSCSPQEVIAYVQFLKDQLAAAGLLGTKVGLLSPMVDKLNPTFDSFRGVYSLGLPSSINEYDQATGTPYQPCQAPPLQNNCDYGQIGLPGPYFALEAGVAGTCLPPCYLDSDLNLMLNEVWPYWQNNSFKMFAIFSYDPHRSGWNLFSAPKTTNFYHTHCSSGPIDYGQANDNQFQTWFSQHQNQLVNCDGCGYAPSQDFCTAAGDGDGPLTIEPETIVPEQSLVCTDFEVENRGAVGQSWIELVLQRFPDWSQFEVVVDQLLDINLSAKFKQALSVDSQEIETRAKHFIVTPRLPNTTPQPTPNPQNAPQTRITLPSIWTRLLGKTRILCAFFGHPPACDPSSVDLTIAPPNPQTLADSLSPNTSCIAGKIPGAETDLNTQTISANFLVPTPSVFQVRSREFLVGGTDFIRQSAAFATQLSAKFGLGYSPLGDTAKYALGPGLVAGPGSEKLNAQGLGLAHARYCLFRCSEYGRAFLEHVGGISAIEPLCPSCNLDDYPKGSGTGNVIEYPAPPQSCSADAPHEIVPSCAQCTDVLFCWGNNYRLCETDPKIPAPALGSRNGSWWFSPGDFPDNSILYNGMSFPVPSGGVYVCDSNVFGCVNERCR